MKTFVEEIEKVLSGLNPESRDYFHASVKSKEFPKNKIALRAGDICRYTFVVEEGCMRKYYLKDGIEITSEFIFPGEMAVSFSSFLQQKPSREFIHTLENSKVRMIPYSVFKFMRTNHSEIRNTDFEILANYCSWLENRLYHLRFHTARERYQNLLDTQPQLVQKIPLTYIASYLGITLETLSRIRSQII